MAQLNEDALHKLEKDLQGYIPQISINLVIFRFNGEALEVPGVLVDNKNSWTIPGGFINQSENLEDAARRILKEQIGSEKLLLKQFGCFGNTSRNFGAEIESFTNHQLPNSIVDWFSRRFITIGYYTVAPPELKILNASPLFFSTKWVCVKDTNTLALDHANLVNEALKILRSDLLSKPLLIDFLPDSFTIPELQKLYEAILGRTVDRGNFRQRMLKQNILTKLGVTKKKTSRRPPILYTLNKQLYLKSLTEDIKLGF